jgi:molecular chaperone DnaJ
LAPGASDDEVKAARRRLASQWHPDRNRSAAAISKMERINQAIEQIRRSGFSAGEDNMVTDRSEPAGSQTREEGGRDADVETGEAPAGNSDNAVSTVRNTVP